MGLDWIAINEEDNQGENIMFRGKIVSNDPNMKEIYYSDDCYGICDGEGLLLLSPNQRLTIMKAIKKVLKIPKEEINLDGWDSYSEWKIYKIAAFDFLQEHKKIHCWY